MNTLFQQKNRSSRRVWATSLGLTALLIGASIASYSHQKGTASNGKLLNKSSLLTASGKSGQAKVKESVGKLPLAFEPNMGQTDPQVKYVARAKGYTAFLTRDETVLSIQGAKQGVLRMKMQNARPGVSVNAADKQPGVSNYIRPEGNIMGVPNYGKVNYKGIYPGIDVAYFGNNLNLEYDFVVSPGADAGQIRMAYDAGTHFALNGNGDIEIETAAGKTLARKPIVYQTVQGVRKPVQGEYVLTADNSVGFKLGAYDHSQTLVIDPTLNIVAFLGANAALAGATAESDAWAIATNSTGTPTGVYMTGRTASLTFPGQLTPANVVAHSASPIGNFNAFITKLDPTGTILVYNTFLGSSGDQGGEGIVVDALGNSYVTGYTSFGLTPLPVAVGTSPVVATSNPAPTGVSPGGVYSAFVAKFSAAGALTALTYLGGPGTTQALAIAMDNSTNSGTGLPTASNGNLVIGGLTNGLLGTPSGEFKTFSGGTTDGFIATFTNALAPVASTYVGGSAYDQVNSVAVDSSCTPGSGGVAFPGCAPGIYAAGLTASGNMVTNPVTAFPTGSTPGFDAAGNANSTYTAALPAVAPLIPVNTIAGTGNFNAGGQTAFAMRYNAPLTQRRYSSIFGVGGESANGIAVDGNGVAYVVGATWSVFFDPSATQPSGATRRSLPGSLPGNTVSFGSQLVSLNVGGLEVQPSPTPTQGYLIALNPTTVTGPFLGFQQTQTINYVALQGQGVIDPAVPAACNLGLPRFAGSLIGVPNPCTTSVSVAGSATTVGFVQSFNGVTVDSDNEVYVAGQRMPGPGAYYAAEIDRFRTGSVLGNNYFGTPQITTFSGGGAANNSQAFGIAVDAFRLTFFDGIVNGAQSFPTTGLAVTEITGPAIGVATTQSGITVASTTKAGPPPGGTGNPAGTTTNTGSVKADGTTEGLYGAIQFLDVFATPGVVNATPITATSPNGGVGLNTPTGNGGPIETVSLTNQFGNAIPTVGCIISTNTGTFTFLASGGPVVTAGNYTIQQISNGSNVLQIQLAAGATADAGSLGTATATINCPQAGGGPAAENNTVITINGSVFGPLDVTANAALLTGLTSAFNSGIVIPYTTTVDATFTLPANNGGGTNTNPSGFFQNPLIPGELVRVPVSVVTPGSAQFFTATISGQSANFPSASCGLLGLDSTFSGTVTAGFAGTLTPPIIGNAQQVNVNPQPTYNNGSIFAARISTACAMTLSPGLYTANIVIANSSGGAGTTIPFSLTIGLGGVVSQNILNLGFLNSTSAAQQTAFSVNAQGGTLTYGTNYIPANPPLNPLPSGNVSLTGGGTGTLANGVTATVSITVTPAGLAPGVYTGTFQVVGFPITNPLQILGTATLTVFVGYPANAVPISGGVVIPSGTAPNANSIGLVNIVPGVNATSITPITLTVPGGFSAANLTNPLQAVIPLNLGITAVGDNVSTPLFIGNTTGVPGVTAPTFIPNGQPGALPLPAGFSNFPVGITTCFLPPGAVISATTQQPPCELRLTPTTIGVGPGGSPGSNNGNTCSAWAPSPQNSSFQQCNYSVTVDTTLLPAGNYAATATFTATNGAALPVQINLVVTPAPTLLVTQTIPLGSPQAGQVVPVSSLTFTGTAGNNATTCQNITVGDTGGTITGANVSTTQPWIAFSPLGNQTPPNFPAVFGLPTNLTITANPANTAGVIVNPAVAVFEVCVNPVFAVPTAAAIFNGSINFVSSGGPLVLPVTLNLSGGAISNPGSPTGSPANFQQIATFRSTVSGAAPGTALGEFLEDLNEVTYNFAAGTTLTEIFGLSGDKPVAGDFLGTGVIEIGVFRCSVALGCQWYVDLNNNGTWDGVAGGDAIWNFGLPGDMPIVGDWTGNGISKLGIMRCPAAGQLCTWVLDVSTTAGAGGVNHNFNVATAQTYVYGLGGDQPVASNWNQTGTADQIGVFRCPVSGICNWIVDSAGTGASFTTYTYGVSGDIPIVGNWQATGKKRIGVFRPGAVSGGPATVILNLPGNNVFVSGIDLIGSFGLQGDIPIVGLWTN